MSQKDFDPLAAWQDLIQKWEIEVNTWSGKVTETEQFGALMGQATKMNLVAQKAWADRMESILHSMNLPSKKELDAIADRLDAIEDNLAKIRISVEARPSQESATSGARSEPKRTRKAPQAKG